MHLTLYVRLTELITDLKSSICLRPQVCRKQTVDANMNLRKFFIMGRYFHIYSFSSVKWIILKFLLLQGPSFFPTCNCTHPLLTLWHIFFRPSSVSPGTSSSIASASQETSSSSEPPRSPCQSSEDFKELWSLRWQPRLDFLVKCHELWTRRWTGFLVEST